MNGLPYQQLPELKDNPNKESSKKNNRNAEEPKPFDAPEPTPENTSEKDLLSFSFGGQNKNSAEKANQSKEIFIEYPTENPFGNTTPKSVKSPVDYENDPLKYAVITLNGKKMIIDLDAYREDKKKWIEEINNM
ncbi:MAG: hypothetical protein MJ252_14000 [archaeon]|nr:hypothetical protein [archaeon]